MTTDPKSVTEENLTYWESEIRSGVYLDHEVGKALIAALREARAELEARADVINYWQECEKFQRTKRDNAEAKLAEIRAVWKDDEWLHRMHEVIGE